MSPIAFDLDVDVTPGVCEVVAPGLRRIVANNPSRFTFKGTGTYLVGRPGGTAKDAIAVVDPGPDLDDHFDALNIAIGDRPVSHILVTHTHNDHSPLSRRLAEQTGAVIYGQGPHGAVPEPDPEDQIDFGVVPEESDLDAPAEDESQRSHTDGGYDASFVPDVAVRHGDVLVGDGWTIDCVHTPGHTSNHMCYGWRETAALFSGDHVMGWSTSVISPPDGDMATYLASLELLLDRQDTTYWPTHGNPITNPHEHVRGFIEHRRGREVAIVELLGSGITTIEQLVRTMYTQVHPKLYSAAARSVHAHLVHLIAMGRVVPATPAARLTDEYRPA